MRPRRPPVLFVHVVRIAILVIAAAGIAWLVASTQRRANRALAERASEEATEPVHRPVNPMDDLADQMAVQPSIDTRIVVPPPTLDAGDLPAPPALPTVWPPAIVPDGSEPEPVHVDLSRLSRVLAPVRRDPFISSSKSMVIVPTGDDDEAPAKPRHGKP